MNTKGQQQQSAAALDAVVDSHEPQARPGSRRQRAAIKAMQRVLDCIARDGSTAAMTADMASFKDREAVVATADFLARDKRYAS